MEARKLIEPTVMIVCAGILFMIHFVATVSAGENISCDYPPYEHATVENQLDLIMIIQPDSPGDGICIDQTDCDPYGIYICKTHKKWSEKCCAEYCNFCH